jgi:hypothetical protein
MSRARPLAALLLACALDAARAEPLGPLLLTPEERRHLEGQRRAAPPAAGAEPAASQAGARQTQRIEGAIVARERGVAGWIEGRRILHGERVGEFRAEFVDRGVRLMRPGQATLQAPVGSEVDLRERAVREPVIVMRAHP